MAHWTLLFQSNKHDEPITIITPYKDSTIINYQIIQKGTTSFKQWFDANYNDYFSYTYMLILLVDDTLIDTYITLTLIIQIPHTSFILMYLYNPLSYEK